MEPNSTWLKKNGNSLVHLTWLCWERLVLCALWPKGLTGVERIQFLGSVFHSDGSAPGICHLTYGNFSRNKQCLFPCCANKALIASHCFFLGHRPNSEPVAVATQRDVLLVRQVWATCLHTELGIESEGCGLIAGEQTGRRQKQQHKTQIK